MSGNLGCADGGDDNAGCCPYVFDQKSACTTLRLSAMLTPVPSELTPHDAQQLERPAA